MTLLAIGGALFASLGILVGMNLARIRWYSALQTSFLTRLDAYTDTERNVGSITVDQVPYGRYAGRLQITLEALTAHPDVAVIGYVHPEDLPLLRMVGRGGQFRFV